jgi:hypothetical protein
MGYTGEQKKTYQREWMRKRRLDWINENGPCVDCGTWEGLEIDHLDPSLKEIHIGAIWSRRKEVRDLELAKCVVRCQGHHLDKSRIDWSNMKRGQGENNGNTKLTKSLVNSIREDYKTGEYSIRFLANKYDVGRNAIHGIVTNKTWRLECNESKNI